MIVTLDGELYPTDLVLLVRVGKDGIGEKTYMANQNRLNQKYNVKETAVQLGDIFGYQDHDGFAYNIYEVDFNDLKDLWDYQNELDEIFQRIRPYVFQQEYIPEVAFARRNKV